MTDDEKGTVTFGGVNEEKWKYSLQSFFLGKNRGVGGFGGDSKRPQSIKDFQEVFNRKNAHWRYLRCRLTSGSLQNTEELFWQKK